MQLTARISIKSLAFKRVCMIDLFVFTYILVGVFVCWCAFTTYRDSKCMSCGKTMYPRKVTYDFDRDSHQTLSSKWVAESNFTQRREYARYTRVFKIQTCECGQQYRSVYFDICNRPTPEPTGTVFAAKPCAICIGSGKVASANPPAYEYDRLTSEWVWTEPKNRCDVCKGRCWVIC